MVKVNGELLDIDGKTIEEYLRSTDFNVSRCAVELNEQIISKSDYPKVKLSDGDSLEVVCFVGGG